MAGERERATEEASPRRLQEARRRGNIALSRELIGSAAVVAAWLAVAAFAPAGTARLHAYMRFELSHAGAGGAASAALLRALGALLWTVALPLGAAVTAAVGVGVLQTRGLLTFRPLAPDPGRLSPSAYLRRVLSVRALAEAGRGLLWLTLVLSVAAATLWSLRRELVALSGRSAAADLATCGVLASRLGGRMAALMVALAVVDYLLVVRRFRRGVRMTRDELRREHRDSEGDPQHRAERQRLHRELIEQRILADVRQSDFVVVNPEHIAVAVRYERDGQRAPVVVARGERLLAQRIKEVAREAGIPVFRDVALARSLHELREGDEVPENLYEAVAEILRVVYELGSSRPDDAAALAAGSPAAARLAVASVEAAPATSGESVRRFANDGTWKRA